MGESLSNSRMVSSQGGASPKYLTRIHMLGWVSEVSVKGGKTTKLVEPIRFKDPGNLERKGMIKKISPAVKGIEGIVADLRAYPFEMSSEVNIMSSDPKS